MKEHIGYHALPEDFPLPDDISYMDALGATLNRADGVSSLILDNIDEPLTRDAIWAVIGLIRQAKALTEHWHEHTKDHRREEDFHRAEFDAQEEEAIREAKHWEEFHT